MINFIDQVSKPDWCSILERFVADSVSRCANATLFGSWVGSEETLLLVDGKYHVLSDVDVSGADGQFAIDLLQAMLAPVIPSVRVDYSDAFAFVNTNQTSQRLLGPTLMLERAIQQEEIAEAIAIRVFYSSLDIWLNAKNLDFHGTVYSMVRMLAEIPLYYCWNSGLICGSYRTQLDIGMDRTLLTRLESFDFVKFCVECKRSTLVLRSDIDAQDVRYLLTECICIFGNAIKTLRLNHSEYGKVSLELLIYLQASLNMDLTLNLKTINLAWKSYRGSVLDGRVRSRYLSKRINTLSAVSASERTLSHFPVCISALQELVQHHVTRNG